MNNLPPRFREKAFRRYEKAIALAVASYPTAIEIKPSDYGLSPNTVAQRLRDAKTTFRANKWPSGAIDYARFCEIDKELVVCETLDGKVRIGPNDKDTLVEGQVASTPSEFAINGVFQPQPILELSIQVASEFALLGKLSQERALSRKLRLRMSDEQADSLYNSYDINLDKQDDGSYILT